MYTVEKKKQQPVTSAPSLLISCPHPQSQPLWTVFAFPSSGDCLHVPKWYIYTLLFYFSTLGMTYWFLDLIYRVSLKFCTYLSSFQYPLYITTVTLSNILKALFPVPLIIDNLIASPFFHLFSHVSILHFYLLLIMFTFHFDHSKDFYTVILGGFQSKMLTDSFRIISIGILHTENQRVYYGGLYLFIIWSHNLCSNLFSFLTFHYWF